MRERIHWSRERLAEGRAALKSEGSWAAAAAKLSAAWGFVVAGPMLRSALNYSKAMGGEAATPRDVAVPAPPAPLKPSEPDPALLAFQRYAPVLRAPEKRAAGKVAKGEVRRGIIIGDVHVPHQDRLAEQCLLGILREWQPHYGVQIGDLLDLESLSRHAKSRPDLVRLSAELYAGNLFLDGLQGASPDTQWTLLQGNHDARADAYACELGQLDGLLNIPEQLFLVPREDGYHRSASGMLRGAKWVPLKQQPFLADYGAFFHGVGYESKYFTARISEEYAPKHAGGRVTFSGHMHTFQSHTSRAGLVSQCVGWMGKENLPVFGYATKNGRPTGWETGVVLQTVTPDGLMSYECVRIVRGRALFGGKVVVAREAA